MKIKQYMKDKLFEITCVFLFYFLMVCFLAVIGVQIIFIGMICILSILLFLLLFLYNYYRKKKFYDLFLQRMEQLDEKYLIIEMLQKPGFYEGNLLYESLYEINKSMHERIEMYQKNMDEVKDYIEMWIHEVKLPLSTLLLMAHNQKMNPKIVTELKRIEDYTEQVLYYVRSENAEKDYVIKSCDIKKIVQEVLLKNKDQILLQDIELDIHVDTTYILTDAKWLVFMLGQILSNSIKYKKGKGAKITITVQREQQQVNLILYDNGMGIEKNELSKIFIKSFTGTNGRKHGSSTGMGLYIVKKLCDKLGHRIQVKSIAGDFTEVMITFEENNFYEVVK